MSWPRPEDNHVGGWIGFGPKDGYLYIDSGDGGLGNDVMDGGGGFIYVAGAINTHQLARSDEAGRMRPLLEMLPVLPEDAANAALAGRVWRPDIGGPSVAVVRDGAQPGCGAREPFPGARSPRLATPTSRLRREHSEILATIVRSEKTLTSPPSDEHDAYVTWAEDLRVELTALLHHVMPSAPECGGLEAGGNSADPARPDVAGDTVHPRVGRILIGRVLGIHHGVTSLPAEFRRIHVLPVSG